MDHHSEHGHSGHNHSGGHGHNHAHGSTDKSRVAWALFVIAAFMLVEVVGGILSGSLALLADAAHMMSDSVALAMSWLALHYGQKPADAARSFGYRRLEVLAAFANGIALFLIAAWIVFEAAQRLMSPEPVQGGTMLVVAVAGALANLAALWILNSGNKDNLNVQSAWLHVWGDLLGSMAAIIAGLVIIYTGWYKIDPILSVLVALLVLKSAWAIVRASSHILLEGTPLGIDLEVMREKLESALPQGAEIHHIHAWSLNHEEPLVTMHVRCASGGDVEAIIGAVKDRLKSEFGVTHSTIQVEPFASTGEDCRIGAHHAH